MSTEHDNSRTHSYAARLVWIGNVGHGTSSYTSYGREYRVSIAGKPELRGSADRQFRGRPDLLNPEDLFLAAIAACHMLTYLSLCARRGVTVLSYEDEASAWLQVERSGGGAFREVRLEPVVTVAAGSDEASAERLHDLAHELCFIASSCRIPIRHRATVRTASKPTATEGGT